MQQKYITFAIGNQQTRVTAMINPQLLSPESIVVIGGSNNTHKPIFPILPSLHTAGPEVAEFLQKGHVNFSDEVTLATALS